MTRRKPTVAAEAAPTMTFADKMSCVAWEACRAWDAVNGVTTREWTELEPAERAIFTAHVAVLLDARPCIRIFEGATWEAGEAKDRLVRQVVGMAF